MLSEEMESNLVQFDFLRNMIKHGETNGRNVIIEQKDGDHKIALCKIGIVPFQGCNVRIDQIERITIIIGEKEFEFVSCQ